MKNKADRFFHTPDTQGCGSGDICLCILYI